VDDFGVKYFEIEDVYHLKETLEKIYTTKIDWSGANFLGLQLDWNYDRGYVDISMPQYINKLLERISYRANIHPQYSSHEFINIKWTKKDDRQYAQQEDKSAFLDAKQTKYVESVVGSLLYYARAIDGTMLPALNQIGTQQAQPTVKIVKAVKQLLDYANTYKQGRIRYYASDMNLEIDSDAAYLVLPKARSRMAGYFRLLDDISKPTRSLYNGAILIECRTLRHVVSSAAEAETNAVFQNAKTAIPIRNLLIAMGHPQKPTLIRTDNSTTQGYVNKNIQLKRSKSWDMNLHWLRDRENRKQFNVVWEKGSDNKGDYYAKHHPTIHHRKERGKYIQDTINCMFTTLKTIYE